MPEIVNWFQVTFYVLITGVAMNYSYTNHLHDIFGVDYSYKNIYIIFLGSIVLI